MLFTVLGGLLLSGSLAVRAAGPIPATTFLDPETALAQIPFEDVHKSTVAEVADHLSWPPHHPPPARVPLNKTIYEALGEDPKYSKIFKLINLNNATIDLLNTTSTKVTFFALPDVAFPKRRHGKDSHFACSGRLLEEDFSRELAMSGIGEEMLADAVDLDDFLDNMKDDHKEKWRRIVRKIIGAIITYHVLPQELPWPKLITNSTYATNLTLPDGSLDGEPLRIHVGQKLVPPSIYVNFLSRVFPQNTTLNGAIHAISFPLLPPPSVFQGLFAFPEGFGTLTSAIQRAALTGDINWEWVPSEHKSLGTKAVTIFAPSNRAFLKLPPRLRRFLFSPFGIRALRKILQYHIVPGIVFHSDYFHNATASVRDHDVEFGRLHASSIFEAADDMLWANMLAPGLEYSRDPMGDHESGAPPPPPPPRKRPTWPDVEYNITLSLPTLVANYSIETVITKYKVQPPGSPKLYPTSLTAQGVYAVIPDIPARNGAVHVIDELLNPHGKKHKHGHHHHAQEPPYHGPEAMWATEVTGWEDWEDWLLQWADEE